MFNAITNVNVEEFQQKMMDPVQKRHWWDYSTRSRRRVIEISPMLAPFLGEFDCVTTLSAYNYCHVLSSLTSKSSVANIATFFRGNWIYSTDNNRPVKIYLRKRVYFRIAGFQA